MLICYRRHRTNRQAPGPASEAGGFRRQHQRDSRVPEGSGEDSGGRPPGKPQRLKGHDGRELGQCQQPIHELERHRRRQRAEERRSPAPANRQLQTERHRSVADARLLQHGQFERQTARIRRRRLRTRDGRGRRRRRGHVAGRGGEDFGRNQQGVLEHDQQPG